MCDTDLVDFTDTLIRSRCYVSPKRLTGPAPSRDQLSRIFEAAAAAPDHGQLTPWRFVVVLEEHRPALAAMFERALLDRDAAASADQVAAARDKAFRSPVLLLCVVDLGPRDPDIPGAERIVSLGCALQNMMLMAQAMGFGSGLTAGRAMRSQALRQGFGLAATEEAVCFLSLGTVSTARATRLRPDPSAFVSVFRS
jgi:nitroreductase